MTSTPSFFESKIRIHCGKGLSAFCLAILALLFSPHSAMAQAASAGDVICNAVNNMGPFIELFNWMSYTAGAFIGANGVYMLARHMEAPGQAPLHQAYARLIGSSLLLALPSLAGTIVETLYGSGGDATSTTTCAPGATAAASSDLTLDMMLVNFVGNIQGPILALLTTISLVFGVFLMYRGAIKASRYGTDPKAYSVTSIVSSMVFGAVFIVVGENVDMIMGSLFGTTTIAPSNVLSWTAISNLGGDTTNFVKAIQAALTFFQIIGFIAFLRGWNVLKNAVEGHGQATVGQGLTHIIGGVLCINVYQFLQIMNTTFGTNFIS